MSVKTLRSWSRASALWLITTCLCWGCTDTKQSSSATQDTQSRWVGVDISVADGTASNRGVDTTEQGEPLPGTFGAPCANNSECDSNFCISGLAGKICSKTCVEDCPTDFACSAVKTGSDLVFICLPAFGQLCDPCSSNADCNDPGNIDNICLTYGAKGRFCASACKSSADCPKTHLCQQVVDGASGSAVDQCVPKDGECTCSPKAIGLQLSTPCSTKNDIGSCQGVRVCEDSGLSACKAATPKLEQCNGLDDDCDGLTDNLAADATCQLSNEHGSCEGTLKACINGVPQCDALAPKPESCNGIDDDCDGVTDNTSQCDDGNPCTQDQCNTSGSCKHSAANGVACDDGDVCTTADACAGKKCQPGNPTDCDDQNPCTKDQCTPLTGCVHSAQDGPCADDGDPCTQDLCKNGLCFHPPSAFALPCAEDGNPCTADVCDKGACTHQSLGSNVSCLDDGDPCTQDVCTAGKCSHPIALDGTSCVDDGLPCTIDACAKGKCAHKPKAGESCQDDGNLCTLDICTGAGVCTHPAAVNQACEDDGNPCTKDICQNKLCKHPYSKAPCSDNNPCTVTDYCDLGTCKGINMLKCDDDNPCTNDLCAAGVGCKNNKLNAIGCTDGNACTTNDTCVAGICKGSGNKQCADDNPCTDDTCTAAGGCLNKPNTNLCADDGNPCTEDICSGGLCSHPQSNQAKPCGDGTNPCTTGSCDAGICKQVANENVCDDKNGCTSNDKCVAGLCQGTAFKDCDDNNPCTQDSCDTSGKCTHTPQNQATCKANSEECPIGICQGGACVSQPGIVCEAKYKADLCTTVKVPGACTASGACVASSVPPAYTCPGCNGICVKCLIFQFCISLF